MFHFHILFDGGSKGNGSATQVGYGSSLLVTHKGHQYPVLRFEFGNTTNNEAEHRALLSALENLLSLIKSKHRSPSEFNVRIVGDSKLVLNQVSGEWKCKADHLVPIRDASQKLAATFHQVIFEHTPRETCVRLLGH